MEFFPLFSAAIAVAALFSYLNHRFLKLPTTIGVMAMAMVASLVLLVADYFGAELKEPAIELLAGLHFRESLLDWMLAFLLFAGALHVDIGQLKGQGAVIGLLATVGVVVTTLIVGVLTWGLFQSFGLELKFVHALLFGALIAPTDPIAVLGVLKKAGAPKTLETKIAGESLFNDGIAVVVFLVVLGFAGGGEHQMSVGGIVGLFAQEVLGSLVLGLVCGWFVFLMLRSVENYQVEVLLTLALAMGLYSLAAALHCSGPLAVVVAGLLIGNSGRYLAMGDNVRRHVDTFWELIDEVLNVVLFVLIGLELVVIELTQTLFLIGLVCIPLVLLARFASVASTVLLLKRRRPFTPHAVKILTWGGLRGGISVALALSIGPDVAARDAIFAITYIVVVFSILVQGLTVGKLIRMIPDQAT